MLFHQQHFHDAFKLCKILHGKIRAVEKESWGKSPNTQMHTHLF